MDDTHGKLLTKKEVAAMINRSIRQIDRMIKAGKFPPATRIIGGRREWLSLTIQAWMQLKP